MLQYYLYSIKDMNVLNIEQIRRIVSNFSHNNKCFYQLIDRVADLAEVEFTNLGVGIRHFDRTKKCFHVFVFVAIFMGNRMRWKKEFLLIRDRTIQRWKTIAMYIANCSNICHIR